MPHNLASSDRLEQAAHQFRQGVAYMAQGRNDLASACFKVAVEAAPDSFEANFQFGCVLSGRTEAEESIKYLQRAVELQPTLTIGHEYLGLRFQKLGRFEEAIGSYQRVLELQPEATGPYFGIFRCKKVTDADRAMVEKLERLSPGSRPPHEQAVVHYALGKAYDDLGEYEKAIGHFDKANAISFSMAEASGRRFDGEALRSDVDLLIRTFTPELFRAAAPLGLDTDLPVLIVGMMRSGTTLTEQILSRHPVVAAGGELSFWCDTAASQVMLAAFNGRLDPVQAHEVATTYRRVLRSIGPTSKRVTDKQPSNYLQAGLIHTLLPQSRFIHCRRNPIDTCLSIYTTPLGTAPVDFAHKRENIVFAYRQYQRLMDHWSEVISPERLLDVDYEELVREPENQTRRLVSYLGLEWHDDCLEPGKSTGPVDTPSLWQVRQPMYSTSVERWKRYEPWLGVFAGLGTDSAT